MKDYSENYSINFRNKVDLYIKLKKNYLFNFRNKLCLYTNLALFQLRICRPLPLQFWSHFHERYGMCWIEWKINFPIFIFRVIVKISYPKKIFTPWLFFGGGWSPPPKKYQKCYNIKKKKNPILFSSKVFKFIWKMPNLLNRKKNQI